jgi:hypothetical protein
MSELRKGACDRTWSGCHGGIIENNKLDAYDVSSVAELLDTTHSQFEFNKTQAQMAQGRQAQCHPHQLNWHPGHIALPYSSSTYSINHVYCLICSLDSISAQRQKIGIYHFDMALRRISHHLHNLSAVSWSEIRLVLFRTHASHARRSALLSMIPVTESTQRVRDDIKWLGSDDSELQASLEKKPPPLITFLKVLWRR